MDTRALYSICENTNRDIDIYTLTYMYTYTHADTHTEPRTQTHRDTEIQTHRDTHTHNLVLASSISKCCRPQVAVLVDVSGLRGFSPKRLLLLGLWL